MKKIAFITLGCKLNFSETSTIARQFPEPDYERVPASQAADVYIINTCAVTAEAEKKCRQIIRKTIRQNPAAQIIVTGCYANLRHSDIAQIPGVSIVVEDKSQIKQIENGKLKIENEKNNNFQFSILNSPFFPAFSSGDRTRSFLKVQDGCDYHCAYCTVPLARGESRNQPIKELQKAAAAIAAQGIKEIVLTGVNIGDFGKSTDESFFELLQALHEVEGIERYRISSIEPNLLTGEMIRWIATSDKILPHFHIPLQSGSNKILGLMRRRYTRELFAQKLAAIKSMMPHAFIGVDVIVGFPGESPSDFEDTRLFLESLAPAFLHVFPYSVRPGTPAAAFDLQVPETEKNRRVNVLSALSRQLHRCFYEQHINYSDSVLFESTRKNGMMFGYTRNYLKVEMPYTARLVGQIAPVRITGMAESGNLRADIETRD